MLAKEVVTPSPGRVITQNLLTSATLYERENVDLQSVQDLSNLIDLFCIYDRVAVLGREVNAYREFRQSELFSALSEAKFLDVVNPGQKAEDVSKASRLHLRNFLGESDTEPYLTLMQQAMNANAVVYWLTVRPDREQELAEGIEWLKGTPSRWDILAQLKKEENYARSVTFVIRTFLYAGYADVHGLYLTPDATRLKIIKPVADAEEDLQNQLLKRASSRNRVGNF
jgi:hypothetical protein